MMTHYAKKVESLVRGNLIDLESCPFLQNHPKATEAYARVAYARKDKRNQVCVKYVGFDPVTYIMGTDLRALQPTDVQDPEVVMHLLSGEEPMTVWRISPKLTDQWGGLDYENAAQKPIDFLVDDEAFLAKLRKQLCGEHSSIVRKDGRFGVLIEVSPCTDVIKRIMVTTTSDQITSSCPELTIQQYFLRIQQQYPSVCFGIPAHSQLSKLWAFIGDGSLDNSQRKLLAEALLKLNC